MMRMLNVEVRLVGQLMVSGQGIIFRSQESAMV
jgi:hypothetical protein